MEIQIRPAGDQDAGAIALLVGQLRYDAAADDIVPRLATIAQSPDATVFVAESGDAVLGFVHVYGVTWVQMGRFAGIGGMAVAEGYRGMGIGTRLLSAAEDWAQSNGCSVMKVRSNVIREESHPFYLGRGFTEEKTLLSFRKEI
jgi:GNAT superfamily N-acetyltransferase